MVLFLGSHYCRYFLGLLKGIDADGVDGGPQRFQLLFLFLVGGQLPLTVRSPVATVKEECRVAVWYFVG